MFHKQLFTIELVDAIVLAVDVYVSYLVYELSEFFSFAGFEFNNNVHTTSSESKVPLPFKCLFCNL